VIGHVCKLLEPEATARQIEIVTVIDAAAPALRADGVQLTQALLNLLINALQAIDKQGRINITVSVSPQGTAVVLEVRDSGPGVAPERLTAVFEPYFTTKQEGSGLGLWIAQQIAVAHGGALELANAPEGGAVFRLKLPLPAEERAHG
jgi:two-component system sensor histidine kinase HydH